MKKIIISLGLCAALLNYACAEYSSTLEKMYLQNYADTALDAKDDSGYITAIGMVVQCKNNPPVSAYAGTVGINMTTPITATSLFPIGSITKSFISVVILQLAAEKHFSIDDPNLLIKYFPQYPKWGHITLRQLMNMTSGIPGNGNAKADDIYRHFTKEEYSHYISPETILNLTYQLPVHFKPGSHYEYSNTNYTLLGQFIEKLTDHTPEYEVDQRIIKKLALQNTYFPTDTWTHISGVDAAQIVHGYAFAPLDSDPYPFITFGEDITNFSLSFANTAGAIVSTPSDINVYLHSLYTPGKLLSAQQLKQFTSVVSEDNGQPMLLNNHSKGFGYGLGIVGFYSQDLDTIIYLYNGVVNGYNFIYFYNPKTGLYLTFAVNSVADVVGFENGLVLFQKLNKVCQ